MNEPKTTHFRTDKWERRAKRMRRWVPAIFTVAVVLLHITWGGPPLGVWHGAVLYLLLVLFFEDSS